MALDLETAISRFENLAGPELRRWFPSPNNCIGAVRITTQVFEKLGFAARPLSVVYQCHNPDTKTVYVSGATTDLKERASVAGATYYDLRQAADGWQGHVVAIIGESWFIDPTWTAAAEYLGFPGHTEPLVIRMPDGDNPDDKYIKIGIEIDTGQHLELHYNPAEDQGYLDAPAWELDHVDIAIETLRRKMLGVMTPEADIEHFVIYRKPRDFANALYVVRRHTLKWGTNWPKADRQPWLVVNDCTDDVFALERIRDEFRAAGRYRLDRFKHDDPCIVEVWI